MPAAPTRPTEAVGVDLGGTKMAVGVVEDGVSDGRPAPLVRYRQTESSIGWDEEKVLDKLTEEIGKALKARPGATGVGIGVPATIDQERGVAIQAVNLRLDDVPIRDVMSERLGRPVFLDNDANLAALAEHRYGAARGTQVAILLTLGTGIGGGVIIGGKLFRGAHGAGAELGHVVVDENGPPCQGNCPNHGCIETLASGTAIAREGQAAAEAAPDSALGALLAAGTPIDGRAVTDAALAGDEAAKDVIATAGRHLGVALANFANMFEPEVIVIGGGAMAAGGLLLDPARAELRSRALPPMNATPVVVAELGPDAGMIGAAVLAMSQTGDEA
jgi:glucokinase